ncbi:NAD(P)-binding Rossmann-fold superfamily protein [Arabidopsis thaliana]|uniref:NAD(P)-binding Rossmann-fold superfamily protein n=1 Tax=Arabidopsis thaliana TaxID=3702 RepID=F4JSP1_ARATH|nr:NAD(P)-binding Rossmann-fold superfamily protein [Arabidopsis thaliana]AEE85925.1 NAD(P)-binding Rossmann-fold superfamily protein [Arabidopsis thaliana]|eukprot:NP_001190881.1 NAD(P)-binding Rossmann-fold superfamily protein [Arabidopsis thaliana]
MATTTNLSFAPPSYSRFAATKSQIRNPLFTSPLPLPSSFFLVRNEASLSSSITPVQAFTEEAVDTSDLASSSSKLVLVVGGTGGVGQLVVASLLKRNIRSRLLLRDLDKATKLFGKQDEYSLQVVKGDTRNAEDLDPSMFEGVTHVICTTGTTAFPSKRWNEENTPEKVDWEGVKNLISALPSSVKRVVLVSSVGVTKSNELPWSIMNLFGVLKYKKMGEDFLRDSGLPFTIIRPGRLTDGPYTSYDLNTLLKATAGERRAVVIGQGDNLVGEVSRLVVAEACIQALDIEFTQGKAYEINSVKVPQTVSLKFEQSGNGDGPGSDPQQWRELFKAAESK